jgi:integrase
MAKTRGQGEGSIFQDGGGRWIAMLELPATIGANGTTKRHRKKLTGRTRKEVAAKLKEASTNLASGVVVDERLTVAQYLEGWQTRRAMSQDVAPATLTSYRDVTRLYLTPNIGAIRLADLTPTHVEMMTAKIISTGRSPRTASIARAVLRRALTDAVRDGLVVRNVAGLARPPRQNRREGRTLSIDQARTLLAHVVGHRLEAAFVVSLTAGLRRGEVLGLQWRDVDLVAGTLTVRRQLRATDDGLQIVDTKTAGAVRCIPLTPLAVDSLRHHRDRHPGLPAAQVFTSTVGTPVHPDNWRHETYKVTTAALGEAWSPHELRHSCASIMLAAGAPLKVVSETLGHSSIRVTADVYGHLLEGDRSAANAMQQALGGVR